MEEYSTVNSFKGRVEWDDRETRVAFDDARKLIDDRTIPNRILAFGVELIAEEGRIKIDVDSTRGREFHRLIIDGEEDWVKQNLQTIHDFENAQTERLRKVLSNKRLTYLQYVLAGSLLAILLPHILPPYPAFDVPVPQEILMLAGAHIILLVLIEIPKRVYPYVVLNRNGTEPLHKVIISALISILSIVSVVFSAIGLLS
jgi:hypothetical protein